MVERRTVVGVRRGVHSRLRRLRARLTQSRSAFLGFVWLTAISLVMLVGAGFVRGFPSDLLLNLGSGFVILAFGSVFFEPVVEQARRGSVEEYTSFDHERFCRNLAAAESDVVILETWTGLLEDTYRDTFLRALRSALDNGVRVRILLLDPDSSSAVQRAEELGALGVQNLIRQNLLHISEFAGDRDRWPNLEVRVYDASVSETIYRWDGRAVAAKLPRDEPGYDSIQYEMRVNHPWMDSLLDRFEELWAHPTTISVGRYMSMPVTVRFVGERRSERSVDLPYVAPPRTQDVHLDGSDIIEELIDHGASSAIVHIGGPDGAGFGVTRIDSSDPAFDDVSSAFATKYGPAFGSSSLLRLVRRDPDVAGG